MKPEDLGEGWSAHIGRVMDGIGAAARGAAQEPINWSAAVMTRLDFAKDLLGVMSNAINPDDQSLSAWVNAGGDMFPSFYEYAELWLRAESTRDPISEMSVGWFGEAGRNACCDIAATGAYLGALASGFGEDQAQASAVSARAEAGMAYDRFGAWVKGEAPEHASQSEPRPEPGRQNQEEPTQQPNSDSDQQPEPDATEQPEPDATEQREPDATEQRELDGDQQPAPAGYQQPAPETAPQPDPEATQQLEPDAGQETEPDATRPPEPDAARSPEAAAEQEPDREGWNVPTTKLEDDRPTAPLEREEPTAGPDEPTVVSEANVPTEPGQANIPTQPGQANIPTQPGEDRIPTEPGQENIPTQPGEGRIPTEPRQENIPTAPGQGHPEQGHPEQGNEVPTAAAERPGAETAQSRDAGVSAYGKDGGRDPEGRPAPSREGERADRSPEGVTASREGERAGWPPEGVTAPGVADGHGAPQPDAAVAPGRDHGEAADRMTQAEQVLRAQEHERPELGLDGADR